MKRLLIAFGLLILAAGLFAGYYFLNQYWIHRYDALIVREAEIYHLDPDLVWSIIYEETYFRPWQKGKNGEVGLMQVTPLVAKTWAGETGMRDLEKRVNDDFPTLMQDGETNIQVGCWY